MGKSRERLYGITQEAYERMLAEQRGVCAICAEHRGHKALCVDHDHSTGEIRQLICSNCNTALGLMEDKPAWLRKAADYLEEHSA
jgi:hypothetical protein